MPAPKKASSKRFEKSVKAIVRDELQEELEEKVAVIGLSDIAVSTPSIPNGDTTGSTNVVRIFPLISQGDGQYNERLGNEIRLKHLDIKMLMNFNLPELSTNDNENAAVGIRVMILRQKDQNSALGTAADFQGNKLLENGLTSADAGPAAFNGTTFNLVQKINREQFSVRYDKTFYMDATFRQFSSGSTTVSQTFFPPRTRVMSKRLTFGKNGLKLTYGDATSTNPTNFPYVLVVGYASTVSNSTPANNLIRYSYTANAAYTDA